MSSKTPAGQVAATTSAAVNSAVNGVVIRVVMVVVPRLISGGDERFGPVSVSVEIPIDLGDVGRVGVRDTVGEQWRWGGG
jgi:hypothetical protein